MKNKITFLAVLFFIVQFILNIENCVCQWVQVSGGMGNDKTIRSLTANGSNIFAGTFDLSNPTGVWISTNNGNNWTQTGLNSMSALALTSRSGIIFAGAWNNPTSSSCGVYRSINNGSNWTQSNLTNKTVNALVSGITSIYAGTSNTGVYISSDSSGAIWYQNSLNSYTIYSIAVNGYNLYAGTYNNGLYYSSNNGSNWTQIGFSSKNVYSVAVNGNYVFAGLDSGVYYSSNNGTNWIHSNLNNYIVESFVVNGNNVFAGASYGGVWLSTNNGANWIQKNQGFSTIPRVYALLVANNYIYAGTQALSVYRRLLSDIISNVNIISSEAPSEYSLSQNYPNPFNPVTKIKFDIPSSVKSEKSNVKIIIYNILGKEIAVLVNQQLQPGSYEVEWDGSNYPSGVYFYKLIVTDASVPLSIKYSETKKMILLK